MKKISEEARDLLIAIALLLGGCLLIAGGVLLAHAMGLEGPIVGLIIFPPLFVGGVMALFGAMIIALYAIALFTFLATLARCLIRREPYED